MGELVNLSLVLPDLVTLFAFIHKLAILDQIVVASLSTTFIAVVFWKISHNLTAKHVTIGYQLQQNVLCPPSSLATFGIYR